MKITFEKENLLEKLSPMMGTVSTKNTITSLEGILIEAREDGTVRLTTYDMNKGIRCFLRDAIVEEPGSVILNAARFLQYMRVMPEHNNTLEINSGLTGRLYSGKASFTIAASRGSEFPLLPERLGDRKFTVSGGVFRKMIGKVIHSVAISETRPQLCGAYFVLSENKMEIVSCDSYTLSRCSIGCEIEDMGEERAINTAFIVPGHALNELTKLLPDTDDKITVQMTNKHAFFDIGDIMFFTRLIDSEYIDYERIVPKNQTIDIKISRESLLSALERACLIAEERIQGAARSYVKIVVSGKMLSITSSSVNGQIYDEIPIEHTGDEVEIGFNCRYLINSVRATEGENLKITMKDEHTGITLSPAETLKDSDFFYLVLPIRMNG